MTNLSKFYADGDWHIVEEILRDCFSSLKYAPSEDTSPEDFKAQVLSNKKMLDAIEKFLAQAKVFNQEKTSGNPWE